MVPTFMESKRVTCASLWRHPIVKGAISIAAFVAIAEIAVAATSFAWANVIVPIPLTPIVISLGDLPQWIIALVAGAGLWKSWSIERHVAVVAQTAAVTAADMKDVKQQTNGMVTALKAAELASGKLEGRKELQAEIVQQAVSEKELKRADAVADAETAVKLTLIRTTPVADTTKES